MFSKALEDFVAAVDTGQDGLEDKADAVARAALNVGLNIDEGALVKGLEYLRKKRLFDAITLIADRLTNTGYENAFLVKTYAQAMIESGQYALAAGALKEARAIAFTAGDARCEADAWGLEGRIYKDLFLRAVDPASRAPHETQRRLLQRSILSYHWVYARAPKLQESHYHGVNAMAVQMLGRRFGITFADSDFDPPEKIAQHILDAIGEPPEEVATLRDEGRARVWDYANAAEACAALGRWDEAIVWINHYLVCARDDAFALNGTLRQFEQVWGVSADDPQKGAIVTALRMALVAAEGGGLTLSLDEMQKFETQANQTVERFSEVTPKHDFALQNEKVLGMEGPFSIKRVEDILARSKAVARVTVPSETRGAMTIGTGFLLHGKYIDSSYAGRMFFFTNAHVISDTPERDGSYFQPGKEVEAVFDRAPEMGKLTLDRLVWCSSQHEHDVSVFEVDCPAPHIADIMEVQEGLPPLKRKVTRLNSRREPETVEVKGKVYVVGHPLGGDLSFSLNDNDLIDHEGTVGQIPGPEPRRVHYRAPTERGNSGSPVFNSRTLKLIGVHHRGGQLPRLNGQRGKYPANEGMWIRPAINALRAHLQLSGDMFKG